MHKKKVVKGAIIGGVIVFLWCLVSWMILPWHSMVFMKFNDEQSVAQAIKDSAPASGIYVLPNTYDYSSSTPTEQMQEGLALMQAGPTMFASVQIQGIGQKSVRPFVISLLIQIIGAGIVTWMLLHTKGLQYKQRVGFATLYGIAIWILGVLPSWNWWYFPMSYILFILFNLVVGWFLAGLAIAKICKS